jgi:hypothetical protein
MVLHHIPHLQVFVGNQVMRRYKREYFTAKSLRCLLTFKCSCHSVNGFFSVRATLFRRETLLETFESFSDFLKRRGFWTASPFESV